MAKESPPAILLVNNPQNSKTRDLPELDLFTHPSFASFVRAFERPLGLPLRGSLDIDRHYASAVMSGATHAAFASDLRAKVEPENIGGASRKYKYKYTGHSVGENMSYVQAGIVDLDLMAWILSERERISLTPWGSTVRYMLAALGVDVVSLMQQGDRLVGALGEHARVSLANRNTNSQVVFSVEASEGESSFIARELNKILAPFKHPSSDKPPRAIPLPISNAFHSVIMKEEQAVFSGTVGPKLNRHTFRRLEPNSVYSPMFIGEMRRVNQNEAPSGWLQNREQALDVLLHQFTYQVDFVAAMEELAETPNLVAMVTADVRGTTTDFIRDNIGDRIPVFNIKNTDTLKSAVDGVAALIKQIN